MDRSDEVADERRVGAIFAGLAEPAPDRLDRAKVMAVFRRAFPLLLGVWPHLCGLIAMSVATLVVAVRGALYFYDAFWQGVAQGAPIQVGTAWFFRLDPVVYAAAGPLAEQARFALRDRVLVGAVLAALAFTPAILGLLYYEVWILQRINHLLRVRLLERFQALSLRFHSGARVGDSIYRMYQDSAMVTNVIRTLILDPAWQLILLLVGALLVASYSGRLALLLLASFPCCLWIASRLSGRMRQGFRRSRQANSDLTARIQETFAGIRVIKALGAEEIEQRRFERESLRAFGYSFRARTVLASYGVFLFWVIGSVLLLITLCALQNTDAGAKTALGAIWTLAVFQSFQFVSGIGIQGVEGLFSLWGRAQDVAVGLDRVFEMLDLEPEVKDAPGAVRVPARCTGIRFENVSFGYQADRPVLRGVSFAVKTGSITAIVGPTGAGKSTLMSLLLRLFDPDAGSIWFAELDLRGLQLQSLRDAIAIALQENVLFGTSVKENIRYAVPQARDEQVIAAAQLACADEFIRQLPAGYETLLGERGAKLSTGQRQRLSIARAILKDAPVLILDEPTAALDAETELRLMQGLASWGKDRVVFVVTHRLSTIRRADQIVYLQDGRALELGSHDELMARPGGAYRALVEVEVRSSAAGAAHGAAGEPWVPGAARGARP